MRESIYDQSQRVGVDVKYLGKEIIELIEACGQIRSADFERLRAAYSASPIEIASEIERIVKSDPRLAAKHQLAREVVARARAAQDEPRTWLKEYRERAMALGWTRDDLLEIAADERPAPGSESNPSRRNGMPDPGDGAESPGRGPDARPSGGRERADAGADENRTGSHRDPGRGSDAGDPGGASPPGPPTNAEPDDDEFPIRRLIAGAAAVVVVAVLLAAVILGNDSARVNPAEQAAWQRAEDSGSSQAYRTFIEQWPNSDRIELARDRLASLAQRQAAAREGAERDQQVRTRQAQRYLAILGYDVAPSGELDPATREAISTFEDRRGLPSRGSVDPGLLRELERAWREAEDEIWRRARATDSAEAVTRYLKSYPEGRHAAAARERLVDLQDDAERRELIESIQRELVRLGRDVEVSGAIDSRTAAEIRDYRISNWQPEDAPVDASLLAALRDLQRWPPQPGETFVDCPQCPAMVVIPGGEFVMGSPPEELLRASNEGPRHRVTVPRFALARTEVTFDQYRQCVDAGACGYLPHDEGWGREDRPVINVSMEDAGAYVRWLSEISGRRYRLPSEAEWEYAARAGTTTRFHTGRCLNSLQANFDARLPSGECPEGAQMGQTVPVASFPPNPFGLFDMLGNVQEWTLDCWNASYDGAPTDGSAWIEGDCSRAVLRGGSWRNSEGKLRSASRTRPSGTFHNDHTGFRPALTLEP